MNVLLTGFTGNLGPAIVAALQGHNVLALVRDPSRATHQPGVELVHGALDSLPHGLASRVDAIVHAAAATAFRHPLEELRRTNVDGTRHLLDFALRCPHLTRFVHVSTLCAAGKSGGLLPEAPIENTPGFVNAYEQSKWEAEWVVLRSGLPVEIVRVAIVAGGGSDGAVPRPGALHHTLRWLQRGLIPMMPGSPDTPVDLVSTEFVAKVIGALLHEPARVGRIVHASAGTSAPRLRELLDHFATLFAASDRAWSSGAVVLPDIVDAETYALFERSVARSGDVLLRRVCADAQSFLPMLLHPRVHATSLAATIPQTDWRPLATRVFNWLMATDWGRTPHPASPRA